MELRKLGQVLGSFRTTYCFYNYSVSEFPPLEIQLSDLTTSLTGSEAWIFHEDPGMLPALDIKWMYILEIHLHKWNLDMFENTT